MIGAANATESMADPAFLGRAGSNSIGMLASSGNIQFNFTLLYSGSALALNDVIGLALDMSVPSLAFYKNNTLLYTASGANMPAGALFAAVGGDGAGTAGATTTNFGDTTFAYTPPAGFAAYSTTYGIVETLPLLTLVASADGIVESIPALSLSATGTTEPGFAEAVPVLTLVAQADAGSVGTIAETMPAMSLSAVGGFATFIIETVPPLTLLASTSNGASVVEALPLLIGASTAIGGSVSTVDEVVPALVMASETGASAALQLPPLAAVGEIDAGTLADFDQTLPVLLLDFSGSSAATYSIDEVLTLGLLASSSTLLPGNKGDVAETITPYTLLAAGLSGNVGTLLQALPLLQVAASAYSGSTNAVDSTLPLLQVFAEAVQTVSEVLATSLGSPTQAWVLNLRNNALTEYTNFTFNSMTSFNGKYLGASESGIVEIGVQDTDGGTNVDATARTGKDDFESSFMKRVPRAYAQLATDGDVLVSTITSEDGKRDYLLPWNGNPNIQQRRIPLGRGPKAEHWQFEIANRNGSYFRLSALNILPQRTSRRVQ